MTIGVPKNAIIYSTFFEAQRAAFRKNNIPLTTILSFSLKMCSIVWDRKGQGKVGSEGERKEKGGGGQLPSED